MELPFKNGLPRTTIVEAWLIDAEPESDTALAITRADRVCMWRKPHSHVIHLVEETPVLEALKIAYEALKRIEGRLDGMDSAAVHRAVVRIAALGLKLG